MTLSIAMIWRGLTQWQADCRSNLLVERGHKGAWIAAVLTNVILK